MKSCLYEGWVRHRRERPVRHAFRYRMMMAYLDLDELPTLLGQLKWLGSGRFDPAAFIRADHFGEPTMSLADAARNLVGEQTGLRIDGPIRVFTQLRYFGHYFSPLNLLYCFTSDDDDIAAVVAEVSNTPWGERHCYVLWEGNRESPGSLRFSHQKKFHVSPFMDMGLEYRWQLKAPADDLRARIVSLEHSEQFFSVSMTLRRRELTDRQVARMLLRYPMANARVVTAIYWQALRLWLKKCPFYPHPKRQSKPADLATK
jgi:hypothetical protein